jgi:pyruvate-formate lyase
MNDKSVVEQVEVNKKVECEKTLEEQLAIMEEYTRTHEKYSNGNIFMRELECLKVIYPKMFRNIENHDLVLGRVDALPVGFGSVTSIGGVGHYCIFSKLKAFRDKLNDESMKKRVDIMEKYWDKNDTRTIYFNEVLKDDTMGKFVDVKYPAIATARLSGMYLNYNLLVQNGIPGLREILDEKCKKSENEKNRNVYKSFLGCLDILEKTIDYHIDMAETAKREAEAARKAELDDLITAMTNIKTKKPGTFLEGIQLTWFFSLLAAVVNYGRMDDYLGELLAADLKTGRLTENKAKEYIKSLFKLIEFRKTTVNGRVITGGKGRKNPEAADIFCKLAIQAVRENKDTEPQFTLRIYKGMNEEIYNAALDAIGEGLTYPILYNDDVNIPAVMNSMQVDEKTAEYYVPFGCGEFVLSGKSVGTPNTCMNILKILNISLNGGKDPWDNLDKSGGVELKIPEEIVSFDEVTEQYKKLLDYYINITSKAQAHSYKVMNKLCGFIFTSLLTDDCVGRGEMLLGGGVEYLGGTNELYGNTNASDSLAAIKKVVFEDKKYTLSEVVNAMKKNFEGFEEMRRDLINAPKYGNDDPYADDIAVEIHNYICNGIRNSAANVGLFSYLVVIINNQVNTEWGRATSASADGRLSGVYMSNANNPQSGADKNGPTAMLNSLVKLKPDYHAGSVQNIKFSKNMFNTNRNIMKGMFKTYFENGGPQLMVTVVGKGELEEAYKNPEKYPNLVVRVGGFSAKFVNLDRDVQEEILNRTLND